MVTASMVGIAPAAFAAAGSAPEAGPALRVEVRSTVDDLWDGFKKKKAEAHGKMYYLISLRAQPSEAKLKRPIDESALSNELKRALSAQGFREISGSDKPEILLSVVYGRGLLKNPYLDIIDEISPEGPVATVSSPADGFARHQIGFEAKLQNAQNEKLFVTVRAVKYPETPKAPAVRLWQTTMILDEPDNHDLNEDAREMFLIGASQFDRDLPKEGMIISTDDPKGKVILRPLKVLKEDEKPDSPTKK